MLKKFLKEFYLPTHVALSFSLFVGAVIFAFCFGNPMWNYDVQTGGTVSGNNANIGATSSFAFIFAIWFVFDCFCHYESDMKEKTRNILVLVSELGELLSLLIVYSLFILLRPDFVVGWIHFLSFALLVALSSFPTYLRYKERVEKPHKYELFIVSGGGIVALIFSIIMAIFDYQCIFLLLILLVVIGAFVGLELFLKKKHKHIRVLERKDDKEKCVFIILSSAPICIAFMPLWNWAFKEEAGYSSMWLVISLIYIISSIIFMAISIVGEFAIKERVTRNNIRSGVSIATMFIGGLGIVLTSALFNEGSAYPLEGCYYMVAVGIGFGIYGTISFLYGEIRRSNIHFSSTS